MKPVDKIWHLAIFFLLFSGCATVPSIPEGLKGLNPSQDCSEETSVGWNMRAELFFDTNNDAFLVLYIDTGFNMVREPQVALKAGFAVLRSHEEKIYYYYIGALPNVKRFGEVTVETPVTQHSRPGLGPKAHSLPSGLQNVTETFMLERKEDSNCVRILAR